MGRCIGTEDRSALAGTHEAQTKAKDDHPELREMSGLTHEEAMRGSIVSLQGRKPDKILVYYYRK